LEGEKRRGGFQTRPDHLTPHSLAGEGRGQTPVGFADTPFEKGAGVELLISPSPACGGGLGRGADGSLPFKGRVRVGMGFVRYQRSGIRYQTPRFCAELQGAEFNPPLAEAGGRRACPRSDFDRGSGEGLFSDF